MIMEKERIETRKEGKKERKKKKQPKWHAMDKEKEEKDHSTQITEVGNKKLENKV